jgi:hypothetical protein
MGFLSRYQDPSPDALEAAADKLAALPSRAPSPVHRATVDMIERLITLSADHTDTETPQGLRIMVAMLRKSKPLMLESVARIEPTQLMQFIGELRDDCQRVIDAALAEGMAGDIDRTSEHRPSDDLATG